MCGVSWAQRHLTAAGVYSDGSDCGYSVVERLSASAESTESHIDSGGLTQSQGEPTWGRRSIQGSIGTLWICASFSELYSPALSKRADSSESLYLVQYADVRLVTYGSFGLTELQVL